MPIPGAFGRIRVTTNSGALESPCYRRLPTHHRDRQYLCCPVFVGGELDQDLPTRSHTLRQAAYTRARPLQNVVSNSSGDLDSLIRYLSDFWHRDSKSRSHYHQRRERIRCHFLHHPPSVRLHGNLADPEFVGDLLVQEAADD